MLTPLEGQLEPIRPTGLQLFVDWRYIKAGFIGMYSGDKRIGIWAPAPANIRFIPDSPYGIKLQANPIEEIIPILPRDKAWEYSYQISTVIYDAGIYRMWYICVPGDHFAGQNPSWPVDYGNVMCYAESDNGFDWRKPSLGITDYNDEGKTNIVYGRSLCANGLNGILSASVFKDPHAPDDERYKLIYRTSAAGVDTSERKARLYQRFGEDMDPLCFRYSKGLKQNRRLLESSGHFNPEKSDQVVWIAGAVSPDGLHWTPIDEPLMVHFSDTMTTAYWDAARNRYVGYFRTWRYGRRCVGRAETEDFRFWPSTPDTVLEAPLSMHPSDDVYTHANTIYPGSRNTYLMFPAIYHRCEDSREIYMASSIDGVNWHWVPGGKVISCGKYVDWMVRDICAGIGLVPLSNNRIAVPISVYAHIHKYPRGDEPVGMPAWAVWKKGRLCSLVAEEKGEFATPDLIFDGKELSLNVETTESGEVVVELRDEKGQPLPGRTFTDADPVVGDSIDKRVTWHGKTNVGALAGKTISMAFRMRSAKLFAFEFVE